MINDLYNYYLTRDEKHIYNIFSRMIKKSDKSHFNINELYYKDELIIEKNDIENILMEEAIKLYQKEKENLFIIDSIDAINFKDIKTICERV